MSNEPYLNYPPIDTIHPVVLLRAAADPLRLKALKILMEEGEHNCSELSSRLQVPLPTMSRNLKILRESGFTTLRKEGTTRWTSLRKNDLDNAFPGLLEQLSRLAYKMEVHY